MRSSTSVVSCAATESVRVPCSGTRSSCQSLMMGMCWCPESMSAFQVRNKDGRVILLFAMTRDDGLAGDARLHALEFVESKLRRDAVGRERKTSARLELAVAHPKLGNAMSENAGREHERNRSVGASEQDIAHGARLDPSLPDDAQRRDRTPGVVERPVQIGHAIESCGRRRGRDGTVSEAVDQSEEVGALFVLPNQGCVAVRDFAPLGQRQMGVDQAHRLISAQTTVPFGPVEMSKRSDRRLVPMMPLPNPVLL